MAQLPMRSEEELCPTNMRFVPNKSNVRIDPDETQDKPLFEIILKIIKHNTIYNAITLTTEVPKIYMQQFWYTASKNDKRKKYYFVLDYQRFEIGAEFIMPCKSNQDNPTNSFPTTSPEELVKFIKKLGYADPLTTVSQVVGEPRGKPTFGMPIPKAMMSQEIKESNAYMNYLAKYPHAESGTSTPKKGMGKGYMRKCDMEVNAPTPQNKKDTIPRCSRTITIANNLLEDQNQALDYAKLVNEEENQQREKEQRRKQRHNEIVFEKQVNKEVDDGYKHLKATGEGLGASLESQDHSDSDNYVSTDDDKTQSDKDFDLRDDIDKSDNEDESVDSDNDDSDKDFDDDKDHAADFVIHPHDKEPVQTPKETQFNSTSVITTLTDDVSQYLVDPTEIQMTEVLNEQLYTESTTMTVTHLLETIQESQEENPAKNVTETPPATTPTKTKKKQEKTLLQKGIKKKNDWKMAVKKRLDDHEQRLNALSQVNNAKAIKKSIQAAVVKEFKTQVPKLLPKVVSDAIKKNLVNLSQSIATPTVDPTEYELKRQLYEKMFQTTVNMKLNKHHDLYDALQESMKVNEIQAQFGSAKTSTKKQSHDDQDPLENHEGEKKMKKQKGVGVSLSKKGKAQDDYPHYERGDDAKEPRHEEGHKHEVQSECKKKFLNKDKITKEDLEGPTFDLLKKRCKNSVELEYNMEQYHLSVTNKIDWANPEENRFHDDLSKPLPLVGPLVEYGVSNSIGYGVSSFLSNTAYSTKLINTAYPLPLDTAYRSSETKTEFLCMTRSSMKELFTPYKEPEREFRSLRRHFKTLSLDKLRSPDFNLLSDQEYSEEEEVEAMTETMEQYMSKTQTNYGSGVAGPKIDNRDQFELKGQFLKELRENTFSGSDNEDANEHIEKVLEIVDLLHVPNITVDQLMLRVFPISLTGAASHWLRNEPTGSIKTWEDLKTKFLNKYCPPSRTAKKMEEINNFQQEPNETLYQAWERFKELLMKCPQHYLTEM
ncbi:hypothetical protein Tco_0693696 [Tanacetum coccineum]